MPPRNQAFSCASDECKHDELPQDDKKVRHLVSDQASLAAEPQNTKSSESPALLFP
jgi:hypothetical protein